MNQPSISQVTGNDAIALLQWLSQSGATLVSSGSASVVGFQIFHCNDQFFALVFNRGRLAIGLQLNRSEEYNYETASNAMTQYIAGYANRIIK